MASVGRDFAILAEFHFPIPHSRQKTSLEFHRRFKFHILDHRFFQFKGLATVERLNGVGKFSKFSDLSISQSSSVTLFDMAKSWLMML